MEKNDSHTKPQQQTTPEQRDKLIENMIKEIKSKDKQVQLKALVATAALSLRIKLSEEFLRVFEPLVDCVQEEIDDDDDDDKEHDENDENEKNEENDVAAAAIAALSCFIGNVEGAREKMLERDKRALKIVAESFRKAWKRKRKVLLVNALDCLTWAVRAKELSIVFVNEMSDCLREARKLTEVAFVKENMFSSDDITNTDDNTNTNNSQQRQQEHETQVAQAAFELFLALSVNETEKITLEYEGVTIFADALKRDAVSKEDMEKVRAHYQSLGHPDAILEAEKYKTNEDAELASRALVGISCCCKFPGTALKLCEDQSLVRRIAYFMTSSDRDVKQQALALFTAIARAPDCKPLVEKALRGARDIASV